MQESKAKGIARSMFYRECLPAWLTPDELTQGNFLVLLGDEPREIPLLDALKIPRGQIFSVERDPAIYARQLSWGLGVSLFCGKMSEYLLALLHANQGRLVLNLDIEGSFFKNLDPAMTSVLLFCWRNPHTVVATYSSIGRDLEMLWEGVKSLAILLWLAPERTREVLASMAIRYQQAGFQDPVRMVLRDLFWVRSHLEHAARATGMVGGTELRTVKRLFVAGDLIWNAVAAHGEHILTIGRLAAMVEELVSGTEFRSEIPESVLPRIGLGVKALRNLVYNAESPWSHRGYFADFEFLPDLLDCRRWIQEMLERLVTAPLTYIDRGGTRVDLDKRITGERLPANVIVWDEGGLYDRFTPRTLEVLPYDRTLAHLNETVRALQAQRSPQGDARSSQERREVMTMPQRRRPKGRATNGQQWVRGGALTDWARGELRDAAARVARNADADTLAVLNTAGCPPRARKLAGPSATAYLATARRG